MKNRYWIIPLEKIEKRYTKQWYYWFKEVLIAKKIDFHYIDGERVESDLQSKFFLNPIDTHIWKFSQLVSLLKKNIKDNDIIFFFDLWFPGIEALAYIRQMLNMKFKIYGFLHAGTWTKWDLITLCGMEKWGKDIEIGWLKFIDKIFVGTNFHKNRIVRLRKADKNKIKVVGYPIDVKGLERYLTLVKKNQIVFTGRKTIDKGYDIIKELKKKYPIIISLDKTKTKEEYYKLLGESKGVIAPSRQENFGISVVEGMALNCIPIVPDRLSYKETVPERYRLKKENWSRAIEKVLSNNNIIDLREYVKKYQYQEVISNMLK